MCLATALSWSANAQGLPDAIATPYVAYTEAVEAEDYERAREAALQAWRAAEDLDFDGATTAILAGNYAELAADPEAALDAYERSAELYRENGGSDFEVIQALVNASGQALSIPDYAKSASLADSAGDLAERSKTLTAEERERSIFLARAYQAHGQWRRGRLFSAAQRAREAMDAAVSFDARQSGHYGLLAFYRGVVASLTRDGVEGAFRLTEAYAYLPNPELALRRWADYARESLSEVERVSLLERLAEADIPLRDLDEEDVAASPFRVGFEDGVERVDARPLRRREPIYPVDAARAGAEGLALVSFDITPEGRTENIEVLYSIPFSLFGEASVEAIESWSYEPATEDGIPVRREGVTTDFRFLLED